LFTEVEFEELVGPLEKVVDACWRWKWGEEDPQLRLPTFTHTIPRRWPPAVPAGLDSCDEDTVKRWQLDSMMFPPCTYREEYLIERKAEPMDLRVASVIQREKNMKN